MSSALRPLLWLVAILTTGLCISVPNELAIRFFGFLMVASVLIFIFCYIFLMFKDPSKLQTKTIEWEEAEAEEDRFQEDFKEGLEEVYEEDRLNRYVANLKDPNDSEEPIKSDTQQEALK